MVSLKLTHHQWITERKPQLRFFAIAPARFHPAAPFVVRIERAGDEEEGDDGEEELHKSRDQGSEKA